VTLLAVLLLAVVSLIGRGRPPCEITDVRVELDETAGILEVEAEIEMEADGQAVLGGFGLVVVNGSGGGGFGTELRKEPDTDIWKPRLFDPWTELGGIWAKDYNEIIAGVWTDDDRSWFLSCPVTVVNSHLKEDSFTGEVEVIFNGTGVSVVAIDMDPCQHVGAELRWFGTYEMSAGGGSTGPGKEIFLRWPEDVVSQDAEVDLSDVVLLVYGYARAEDGRFVIVGPILEELGNPPRVVWQGEGAMGGTRRYWIDDSSRS
jgi:hypothetical protein